MTTVNKNFMGYDVAAIPLDTEYRNCNFARRAPDTSGPQPVGVRLFPGDDTPRTFIDCNLINCEVPPGSTVTNCNTAIIEYGVADTVDRLTINGVEIHSKQKTKMRAHGRWTAGGYEYFPSVVESPE